MTSEQKNHQNNFKILQVNKKNKIKLGLML